MLDNAIIIAVNETNDGITFVDHNYTRFDEFQNRSVYVGDLHTTALRDTLTFYRTFPKVNGNFRGTSKVAVKFTQDIAVPGVDANTSLLVPMIGEMSYSLPVGLTDAQALMLRQKFVALTKDGTIMIPLTKQLMV